MYLEGVLVRIVFWQMGLLCFKAYSIALEMDTKLYSNVFKEKN